MAIGLGIVLVAGAPAIVVSRVVKERRDAPPR